MRPSRLRLSLRAAERVSSWQEWRERHPTQHFFVVRWLQSAILLLFALPLLLMAGALHLLGPGWQGPVLIPMLAWTSVGIGSSLLLHARRAAAPALCLAVAVALVALVLPLSPDIRIAYGFSFYFASLLGLRMARATTVAIPTELYWLAVILAIAAYIAGQAVPALQGVRDWISANGIATIAIAVLGMHRAQLEVALITRDGSPPPPRRVLTSGRLYVAAVLACAVVIASIGNLIAALAAMTRWFLAVLHRSLFGSVARHSAQSQTRPSSSALRGPKHLPPPPPASDLVRLREIGGIVLAALAALTIVYLLYRAARQAPRLIRRLLRLFGRSSSGEQGYTESRERIAHTSRARDASRARHRTRQQREPAWTSLTTSGERVRWLYRAAWHKAVAAGHTPNSALTPREACAQWSQLENPPVAPCDDLLDAYESVRYGEREISDETVTRLYRAVTAAAPLD